MAKRANGTKRAQALDWKIVARGVRGGADLIKVKLDSDGQPTGEEQILEMKRGPALRKRGKLRRASIVSDTTGSLALQAFRMAVREAKAQ